MPLMFVLFFGGLMLAAGGAIDIASSMRIRSHIQSIADSAALTGATQYRLSRSDSNEIKQVALSAAQAAFDDAKLDASAEVTVDDTIRAVTVVVTAKSPLRFLNIASNGGYTVNAKATARAGSSSVLCLLALGDDQHILQVQNGRVTAPDCSVNSNSRSAQGIVANVKAFIAAKVICSSGGYQGGTSNFNPMPSIDCPVVADPLYSRAAPVVGRCDFTDMRIDNEDVTLKPGVYCNGITIKDNSRVRMMHGTYIMKDGDLRAQGNSTLIMVDAAVYLTGHNAELDFSPTTTLDLSAPVNGPLAGILFFEDRNADIGRTHQIASRAASKLLGTIYLSRGKLVVGQAPGTCSPADVGTVNCPDSPVNVADQSAWTLIVAHEVNITSGVNLVLNSGYDATAVPVPPESLASSTILTH